MNLVALFLPAALSLRIWYRRKGKEENEKSFLLICKYFLYVAVNAFLSNIVVIYVLRLGDVNEDAFSSFPFFGKYIAIAFILAFLVPYIEELVKKWFSISFSIKRDSEKGDSED